MSSNFEPSHQKINKNIDNRGKNQIQSNICWSTFCVAQYVLNLIFLHYKYFIAVVKAIKAYVKRIMIFGTLHQNWLMLGDPAQQLSRLNIKLELFLILSKPDQTKPATATSHKSCLSLTIWFEKTPVGISRELEDSHCRYYYVNVNPKQQKCW